MICLTLSKFYEFIYIKNMSDSEKTPSLTSYNESTYLKEIFKLSFDK